MIIYGINVWPLAVLAISLVCIIVLITRLRIHPFIALISVAILTGGLSETLPSDPGQKKAAGHWVRAVELTTEGFGKIASKIGIVIALASVIGVCLVESGAADKIVRRFLALFGENRAPQAIFAAGYVLSIPIYFETYFMLLLPLAQALHLRTKRHYMFYVLAICCGGTVTHSLVAPHPGPLAMAENLHLDIGQTILCGILAGLTPAICAWFAARWISGKLEAPMRVTVTGEGVDPRMSMAKSEDELPGLFESLVPIILPLLLIGSVSVLTMFGIDQKSPGPFRWIEFFGDRHIALLIGAGFAMRLMAKHKGVSLQKVAQAIGTPFAMAAVVTMIASAGGAFGSMLKNGGVGDVISAVASRWDLNLIILSWFVCAVIRVSQGSATVAMITTSAIMQPVLVASGPLPYHTIYIFLAIGFGSKMFSWMNDSGFWTISKFSGFTETETLKSWSVLVSLVSFVGLLECLIFSRLLPFAR